ncbi:hypothetical protein FRC08_003024 [Ceratobasidium sp. 394]|nr:hypothetical protein FRC08_003024 [Ceratobasidium sp. 394]
MKQGIKLHNKCDVSGKRKPPVRIYAQYKIYDIANIPEHCTESRNAGESLAAAAEVSSTGRKKRKRQEKTGAGVPQDGDTAEAGPSNAAIMDDTSVQPVGYQGDSIYAPPTYSEELPFGWRPIWSFEHSRFYFHQFQTGATIWEDPRSLLAPPDQRQQI